uniref:Uncharacterized protein n=1 Tax=Arundo donax TaxID=35708 RepID=A0A0A8YVX5_ARUDO
MPGWNFFLSNFAWVGL